MIMKKLLTAIFAVLFVVAFVADTSRADSVTPDPYNVFEHGAVMPAVNAGDGPIAQSPPPENNSTLLIALSAIVIAMGIFTYLLLNSYRRLKSKTNKIRRMEELLKTFIDADSRIICLKDENQKYLFVNKGFEEFFGKSMAEVIGRSDRELTDNEFAELIKDTDIKALESRTVTVREVVWSNRTYKTTKFPVKLLSGRVGVGAYIEDVTEEHKRKIKEDEMKIALGENEEKLDMILNSTAEAIYGIDTGGNCVFCNDSCLKILGYKKKSELIGSNMHHKIHYQRRDGSALSLYDCKVYNAFVKGDHVHSDDEVFWRADGTCFEAEYFSYPQYKDGKIVGAVVTFMDISQRKAAEKEILHLSFHDPLTGLYNRRFFNEKLTMLDKEGLLPISIIIGDVNGLKQTNDIFGHFTGDILIQKAANSILSSCRNDDVAARLGGDEFVVLLPNTNKFEAEAIAQRIKEKFSNERVKTFRGSISLGLASKEKAGESIFKTIEYAEEDMYAKKVLDRGMYDISTIDTIIGILHNNCPRELDHSRKVSELCVKIGTQMKLPESQLRRLELAGFFHDIGKVILDEDALNGARELTEQEWHEFRQHPIIGYKVLNSSNDTMDLANYVLSHHENWDGTGYPKGLRKEEIPMLSRVIAIVESYDAMINPPDYFGKSKSKEVALSEIKRHSGSQFDPVIAEVFIKIMSAS
jgi:diguanylate cyclase (GGDEF)-like protein/PAS domain S-box-containing protein